MPRTYKRKTVRASYTQEDLQRALAAIAEGAALKSTAKAYGISPGTLRRHKDGKVAKPGSVVLGRFRPDIRRMRLILWQRFRIWRRLYLV